MTEIVKLAHNAVVAKLYMPDSCQKQVKDLISDALSFYVEGAEFMKAFGAGRWDGRSSFYSRVNNSFPAGFVDLVYRKLVHAGYRVQLVRQSIPTPLGPENPIVDKFGNDDPRYDFQMQALRAVEKHGRGIIQVATGGGKCLGRDTPILMFDGTIRSVQDVIAGDLLMGPDSKPRRVLSTCSGRDPLYRVTPKKGDAYIVNNAHILSLKKTSRGYRGKNRDGEKYPKGEIVNINVEKYLATNKTFRHTHKGWRTGVDFPVSDALPVDPYFVGLLLGDGSINGVVGLTTMDPEVTAEIDRQAKIWDLKVMAYPKEGKKAITYYLTQGRIGGKSNPLTIALRGVGLGYGEKFIPHIYKTASRADRLALLAGLLDTDGYYDGKGFYLTQKQERLIDDAIFLARSLGFAAYKRAVKKTCTNNGKIGDYFSTVISGDLDQIPVRLERRKAKPRAQKKDHLVTGLEIEPIGEGEYFGFEIDGDSLFLLGDFTVTHNTKIAKLIVARYRRMTMFLTTRGVLMYQMKRDCERNSMRVGVIGDGLFSPVNGVNVGMVQTLVARLKETTLQAERMNIVGASIKKGEKLDEVEIMRRAKLSFEEKTRDRMRIIKLLSMVEVVIGEEAHEAGGNSYFEILQHCKNAQIRVALTATPFMRDDAEDNMRLQAAFGPILIRVSEKMLIDRGILAEPFFLFDDYEPHPKLRKTSPWQRAYQLGIMEAPDRNERILAHARKAVSFGLPVMILIQRKDHGAMLLKRLNDMGIRAVFLRGENDQTEREKALAALGAGTINALIGTTILDVGVDVPAIGMVILAGGGKAEVAHRQRIGRGLRAKKNGPNVAFIVDFNDSANMHLREHAKTRRQIVLDTPGFAERIVRGEKELPWHRFSIKSVA